MSHLRGFNLCVVFEVWCLLIRVKSPSCAALFESAHCEDSLFKRSYMKNSKLAWGGHSHAAVDLLLPGYIMFHNKKFDQDTTGSINGYYILLTSFSFLLSPLTIFCMNERPSRRTELTPSAFRRHTSSELHSWVTESFLTKLSNHFMNHKVLGVFMAQLDPQHLSRYMNDNPSASAESSGAWSFSQVWLDPLSRPQCSLKVDTVHLLQFLQGKDKTKLGGAVLSQ